MAPTRRKRDQAQQELLSFEYDPTGEAGEVTARAGLPVVLEMMRGLRLHQAIEQHVQIRERRSGFSEPEHIEALVLMLAAGGECLDDLEKLAADQGLLRLLEKRKLPSPEAARQFLHEFHDEEGLEKARAAMGPKEKALLAPENAALQGLARVVEHAVKTIDLNRPMRMATLEMDATIIESRKQEAEAHYKGGRGYQPELVHWVEQDLVVADEFRDGNVPAGKQPLAVIKRGFAVVPQTVEQRRFRADSAAYEKETLKWLADPKNRIERFTVSADMGSDLHKLCEGVPAAEWKLHEKRASETQWWAEVALVSGEWPKDAEPLRTLVRKVEKKQGELFADGAGHRYFAVVTNDWKTDGGKLLKWHYAKAGCIEKVHDVLKNELGAGVMPCGAFGANAAWYRICALTYNVLTALKHFGLPPDLADARPKRLRFVVFTIPARIVTHARRAYARLAKLLHDAAALADVRAWVRRLAWLPLAA